MAVLYAFHSFFQVQSVLWENEPYHTTGSSMPPPGKVPPALGCLSSGLSLSFPPSPRPDGRTLALAQERRSILAHRIE